MKKILVAIMVIMIAMIMIVVFFNSNNTELHSIRSIRELEKRYNGEDIGTASEVLINIVTMPFSVWADNWRGVW